ncbi:MAG: 16S rRNA (guanine(966)-N(2))-methyltransferase RsmD [Bryobacterales bacterium]|nr:16S rRNA (guanine(966)-N(2))-methyltransferase RsmD [Bryobacterales bacterium]
MRIIGGEFRSRRLQSPEGLDTRPTPDRLRESLFNILAPRIDGTVFADAYAGCGSVGIEALSRGARKAVFIERNRANAALIQANLHSLGALPRAQVIHGGVTTYLGNIEADFYFLDPPYDRPGEYEAAMRVLQPRAASSAWIIAQHATREKLADAYGAFTRFRSVKQGDNTLSFYRGAEV